MKRTLTVAVLCSSLVLIAWSARADAKGTADKSFGLGVMLGAPSGLSGKYYLAGQGTTALAFGVGTETFDHYAGYDFGAQIHMDVLWHPVVLTRTRTFDLPLYIGVGGQALNHGYYHGDHEHSHTDLGVRMPVGLAFDFNRAPLDVFLEFVPVVELAHTGEFMEHNNALYMTAAVGLRYYF